MSNLKPLAMVLCLYGVSSAIHAGTVSAVIDTTATPGSLIYSLPLANPFTTYCSAVPDGEIKKSVSSSSSYKFKYQFKYVGSDTDLPPATVTASYLTTFQGDWSYSMSGSTSPTDSISASFSVTITEPGGSDTLAGATGTIAQNANLQSSSYTSPTTTYTRTNEVVNTPLSKWVPNRQPDGTVIYIFDYVVKDVSGSATATITTPNSKTKQTCGAGWKQRWYSYSAK